MTKSQPALPHRAGKAYRVLLDAADALAQAKAQRPIARGHVKGPRAKRNIVARGVYCPEPDLHKLAHVIIDVAEKMAKEAKDAERAA